MGLIPPGFGFGGLPRRRPDQPPPPRGVMLLAPQGANLFALRVVIFGPEAGLFVYNGQPGPGNGPVSWDSIATTDPFGNPITPALGLSGLPFLAYAGLASQVTQVLTGGGNFTVPAGVTSLSPQLWGPGGNGGPAGGIGGGGGGGGGQYAAGTIAVTPAQVIPYQQGLTAGQATTFGTATAASGQTGGTGGGAGGLGGFGGSGSTGLQIRHDGGAGGLGSGTGPGGGGGGSGGTFQGGNASTGTPGALPVSGGGGGGNGGLAGNPGSNGTTPGGGGGGGGRVSNAGGLGAAGAIQVSYSTGNTQQLLMALSAAGGTDTYGNTYGGGLQIFQPGNQDALTVHGNSTAIVPQFLVLDYLGNTILGAGIQGVYGIGDPFICYSSFASLNPAELVTITPLADGLTTSHSGGLRTPGPAESDLDSIVPVAGSTYLNWQGLQDTWSGVDHACFLQLAAAAAGSASVSIGQSLILAQNLVNGTNYTTLALLGPANAGIPNGTQLTLMNGSHGQNASQVITLSHAVAIGDTSVQVTSFTANFSYPGFTAGGNAPTTWMIVGAAGGTFPWNITPVSIASPAGVTQTAHWHLPVRWWFNVTNAGLTIGALHAYAA